MKTKFFRIFALGGCVVALLVAILGLYCLHSIKKSASYVSYDSTKFATINDKLTILDSKGNVLQEAMYYKNIKQVALSKLPKHVYMAFVAVEDKRFFQHKGIDLKRVGGAIVHNIKAGGFKEGASTISQQLIKNTHLDNSKTIERKVNEMLLARQLEKNYSKEEILEIYLNTIYFGRNAYGIENASNLYFGKPATELTIAESATLAGMIKAPNIYAPDKNLQKCMSRRNIVLQLMLQQELISQQDYEQAKNESIIFVQQNKLVEKTYMYYALKEACEILNMTESQLLNSNYTIETFCEQDKQSQLCEIARNDATTDKNENISNLACVLTNNCGDVIACYIRGESADTKGQVGSTFKPIAVYTPALNERIITQASPILDEQTDFNGYVPKNVGGYNGWTTIKQAVVKSLNVPAVKTLNALSLSTAEEYLQKLGFTQKQNLSVALGNVTGGATPFELAKCYQTLANNGSCSPTRFIKRIYSATKGNVYVAHNASTQVFSPTASYLMTDMLREAVNCGTAKLLKKNYQVAAKTGTVGTREGNTDAIVAGYTTKHTFVVWYRGNFDNTIIGANAPCKVASKLLDEIYKETLPKDFEVPSGVVNLTIDKEELQNNQLLKIAHRGENFWFDVQNRPHQKSDQVPYNYQIDFHQKGNKTTLQLPAVENGRWKLYRCKENSCIEISLDNNTYTTCEQSKSQYYAKLYLDGKFVYQTPTVDVCPMSSVPAEDKQGDTPQNSKGILDFWYW